MLEKPFEGRAGATYWYILQTHAAAEVAFNRYVNLFPKPVRPYLWEKKPNESEKNVFLMGGRTVGFRSGQNFDDLRIETLDGAVIDECRQQDKKLWSQVIRPMLGRHKGWCDFYSTPNGFDWFFDLAESAKKNPEWDFIRAPSWEAPWWTPEEIESAKSTMTEPEFAQEIGADFRDLTSGKIYMMFGEQNYSKDCPWMVGKQFSPYQPIIVGLDFNLSPMHWTLGQENADRWWWFDEIHLTNSHTSEAAKVLAEKVKAAIELGLRSDPHVIICGDATGKSTQRASNQSDYDIVKQVLKDYGIKFSDRTPEANPSIKDRVNAVNAKCKNAKGEINLWVNQDQCPKLVYDFQRVTWKPGGDYIINPGTDKMLGHATDSIGYPITHFTPVKSVTNVGKNRIIHRSL